MTRLNSPMKSYNNPTNARFPCRQMILEAQALRDQIMDRRVQSSILSNRLVRLDNPMLRDRIAALKAEAEAALQSNARIHEELLGGSAGGLASVATDVHVGSGAMGADNGDVV